MKRLYNKANMQLYTIILAKTAILMLTTDYQETIIHLNSKGAPDYQPAAPFTIS